MSSKRFRLRFTFWLDVNKKDEAEIADKVEDLKRDRLFAQTIRDGIKLIMSLREGNLEILFDLFPWVRAEFLDYVKELGFTAPPSEAKHSTSEVSPQPETPETQNQMVQIEAERRWLEAEAERLEQERLWHEKRMQEAEAALAKERERIEQERSERDEKLDEKLSRIESFLLEQGKPLNQSQSSPNKGLRPVMGKSGGPRSLGATPITPPSFADEDDSDLLEIRKDTSSGADANENLIRSIQALMDYKR